MTNAKKIAEALNTEFCRTGVILTVEEMIEIIAPQLLDAEKLATGLADRLIDGDFYPSQDEICGDPEDANYGSTNEQYRDRLIDDFTAHLDGGVK